MPGGTTMDAVHRSVLLRFPGAADQIADLLRGGRVLLQAELALRFGGTEIVPEGYLCRDGLGRKVWTENPPNWHVQAWALRHPWKADKSTGPTFNAQRQRQALLGALRRRAIARDRLGDWAEPQELSTYTPEARIDFTRLLATAVLAREAGERLRWLEQAGFLLRKLETYDSRYRGAGRRLRMGDADRRPRPALRRAAPGRHAAPHRRDGRRHPAARPQGGMGAAASPTARGRPPCCRRRPRWRRARRRRCRCAGPGRRGKPRGSPSCWRSPATG